MEFNQFVGFVNGGTDQGAFMFFLIGFGRLDYGIKCEGSFIVRHDKIDWAAFSRSLPAAFFEAGGFGDKEFSKIPPEKWNQDQKQFEAAAQITNTNQLIVGLNRFRNNLFHGNKGKLRERDHILCYDAIEIVRAVYNACLAGDDRMQSIALWAADVEGQYRDSI
ncbi:hypothetical protein [Brucella sp. BZ]|uniref:hypothetical protein n=1 Tax=Brucella sp. BZ TaxID=3381346 RepID=UPI0039E83841